MKPCVLTIAGSDSGGNAGIQADLRAFHAYGLHGCTVITSITAQNPLKVIAAEPVSPALVEAQLRAVLGTYNIKALKTGMLGSAQLVEVVANVLKDYPKIPIVCDPVMVATSGSVLSDDATISALISRLFPLSALITPNIPEWEIIKERAKVGTVPSYLGTVPTLVKGGHSEGGDSIDELICSCESYYFSAPRIVNPVSTHGTGCSLSAAIAAELALGRELRSAIAGAKKFVTDAIAGSYKVGEGEGVGVLGFAPRGKV